MASFILDASVTLSWCFEDESTSFTDSVQAMLQSGVSCLVPPVWPSEVANGVRVTERRGRITVAEGDEFLSRIMRFPIEVALLSSARIFQGVLPLARHQGLTVYDASYLSLALWEGLPLATLDVELRKATGRVGIVLL